MLGTCSAKTPRQAAGDKKQKSAAFEQFKNMGISAREQYTDEQKAVECSKSDTIQFVIALGHPGKPQKRVQGGQAMASFQVVGYMFKALEDVSVPVAKQIEGAKSVMDCEIVGTKEIKAGETFQLTLFETGCFISRIEYGGHFTGGGDEVILHATVSQTHEGRPLTVLKRPSSPIKDKMELIAEKVAGADGNFSLNVPAGSKLEITYIGMNPQTVKASFSIGDKRLQGRILIEHEETVADIGV